MSIVKYKLVDAEGDEMSPDLFKPGSEIPVKIRSVRLDAPNLMTITLEYLHGQGTDQAVPAAEEAPG
jgi:hypothetical protein